jgi:hypothetical protein
MTPEVCKLITEHCVPFVRNCLVADDYPGDGAFWAKLGSQKVHLGNSMFLCTADGRAVEGFNDRHLSIWLKNWKKLPEAERAPRAIQIEERGAYKGSPRNPKPLPGGLFVKTYMRALDKKGHEAFFAPDKLSLGISKTVVQAEPNRDFLWLKPEEWRSLVPANPKKGDTFAVPAAIRDRIFRFHLVDGPCCLPGFWKRGDIHAGELQLTVEDVSPAAIHMRLRGSARLGSKAPHLEFDLAGALSYDRTRNGFTRFDVVALSKTACHRDTASGRGLWLAIAFELGQADRPADCRVPYRIWYDQDGLTDYFGG